MNIDELIRENHYSKELIEYNKINIVLTFNGNFVAAYQASLN